MRKIKDEQDFLASLDAGEKLVKQGWANKYITKMPLELTEKMKLDFGIQADAKWAYVGGFLMVKYGENYEQFCDVFESVIENGVCMGEKINLDGHWFVLK